MRTRTHDMSVRAGLHFCISNSKLQLAASFHLNITILVIITFSVVLGVRKEIGGLDQARMFRKILK
jgi:hypothetical protein